jgi:hypothetical protein
MVQYNNQTPATFTNVTLCYTNDNYLYVNYSNQDYYIINNYTHCNDPLYKQDVNELFIANYYDNPL